MHKNAKGRAKYYGSAVKTKEDRQTEKTFFTMQHSLEGLDECNNINKTGKNVCFVDVVRTILKRS